MSEHHSTPRSRLTASLWNRHANPGSVWSLVVTYPLLVLAIYRRNRLLLVGGLLFVVVNPLVFRPPADDDAWATRVVRGEEVFLEQGSLTSIDTFVIAISAPVYLYTLGAAIEQKPVSTAVGTVLSMLLMALFFERMSRWYEQSRDGRDESAVDERGRSESRDT